MNNILGQVVLPGRDEYLGATDSMRAVFVGDCLGANEPQVGAALGLGQAHGARPDAADHLWQIAVFELIASKVIYRAVGATRQADIGRKRYVGRASHFLEQHIECSGHTLPAVLRVTGQAYPTALGILAISIGKSWRGGDLAIFVLAATAIAAVV